MDLNALKAQYFICRAMSVSISCRVRESVENNSLRLKLLEDVSFAIGTVCDGKHVVELLQGVTCPLTNQAKIFEDLSASFELNLYKSNETIFNLKNVITNWIASMFSNQHAGMQSSTKVDVGKQGS